MHKNCRRFQGRMEFYLELLEEDQYQHPRSEKMQKNYLSLEKVLDHLLPLFKRRFNNGLN